MFAATTQVRVRYGETDQMGYVYYGNYFLYYEVARTEALRDLGFAYSELEKSGIMLPVAETYSKYIKPVRYDELITIKTFVKEPITSRIKFEYEVYNEKNELVNIGTSTLVFIDMKTNKPSRPPESLVKKMNVLQG